MKFRYT